ncbi:transposase [Clostridium sp. JNZ X4-2]
MLAINALEISSFFPKDSFIVTDIENNDNEILIKLKSKANSCECPRCHTISNHYHGTYIRKVQDLPILGKGVLLEITSHDYCCDNEDCDVVTIAETYHGFLNPYSRKTERLEDFICTLALETSCEGASRICKLIGIDISGDTIIRLLINRYEQQPKFEYGSVIGIDDFAFKKRHTYGTIIVDEKSHRLIDILDGRDGKSLRQWLKNNKKIKTITRDRASAYAKVIAEELPDIMQVADRFHLHQNLLEAIKKTLNREVPATIAIPHENETVSTGLREEITDDSKKNHI